jgi:pentatricopeptide repeat protein
MKELAEPDEKPAQSVTLRESHSCTGCGHDHSSDSNKSAPAEAQLPLGEQYQLLIHTLPGDLPARYALMGEEFAYAYMTSHLGEHSRALEMYEQLLPGSDNDILHYETAITKFQLGDVNGCEELLSKAVGLNEFNPLCNLSMAQLYCRTGRYEEAIARLQLMLDSNILSDQAMMLLGDVYELQGNEDGAVQIFSQALNVPALKRAAAERLLPILERQGRAEDVQYLQRHYLKGCC